MNFFTSHLFNELNLKLSSLNMSCLQYICPLIIVAFRLKFKCVMFTINLSNIFSFEHNKPRSKTGRMFRRQNLSRKRRDSSVRPTQTILRRRHGRKAEKFEEFKHWGFRCLPRVIHYLIFTICYLLFTIYKLISNLLDLLFSFKNSVNFVFSPRTSIVNSIFIFSLRHQLSIRFLKFKFLFRYQPPEGYVPTMINPLLDHSYTDFNQVCSCFGHWLLEI